MKKLVIIDINNFVYRAYYGIQQRLTAPDGTPVNAVFGVFNMIHRLLTSTNPTAVVVAKDSKKSLRKDFYPQYKENRSRMPDDLLKQVALIHTMLDLMNLKSIEVVGYEADDIINSLAKNLTNDFDEIYIASGDKDLMQLVNTKVKCIDTMKDKTYGSEEVLDKLGVLPHQIVDFLALVGDSSDNIPGVKGIGEKTAIKLINQFGSIDSLYSKIQELPESKTKANLIDQEDQARLSYQLAILKDIPVEKDFPLYNNKPSQDLVDFFTKLNMKSVLAKLSSD
jgi:DNA polymerase-1